MDMEEVIQKLSEALVNGDRVLVAELTRSCLEKGMPPELILDQGLIAAMNLIAERFKKDEIFLPEVMIAARAMQAALDILEPLLSSSENRSKGKIVLGTVRGDLHDIGKNIVSIMFRGAGFKVIDLGIDVSEERFAESVKEYHPDILGLSALLTMTLPMMKRTIEFIQQEGLRKNLIIMVGGAPVTERFAGEIGADGYAPNAASAVDKAKELLQGEGKYHI
jgi:5-methyltetrahydrofolate--homocysteine methyltransferase